eukprot:Em0003g552a
MQQASCNGLRSGWLEARKLLSRCFQRKTQPITAALRSAYRSGSNHHAEGNATELQTVRWKKDEGWADLADKLRELPTRVTLIWKKRPKNISLLMTRETRTLDGLNRPFEGSKQKAQRRDTVLISIVSHESFFLYANLNGIGINFLIDTGQRYRQRMASSVWGGTRNVDWTSIGQRRWFYVTDTWNVKEVQQFPGFTNHYRRFIKSFAKIAKPLHKLTERSAVAFRWTLECQRSFNLLKNLLSSPPILVYPDFTKPFILDTDASNEGIGAVLSQLDSQGRERVIAYGADCRP